MKIEKSAKTSRNIFSSNPVNLFPNLISQDPVILPGAKKAPKSWCVLAARAACLNGGKTRKNCTDADRERIGAELPVSSAWQRESQWILCERPKKRADDHALKRCLNTNWKRSNDLMFGATYSKNPLHRYALNPHSGLRRLLRVRRYAPAPQPGFPPLLPVFKYVTALKPFPRLWQLLSIRRPPEFWTSNPTISTL